MARIKKRCPKVSYRSWGAAARAALKTMRVGGEHPERLHPYPCPRCGNFHVGHGNVTKAFRKYAEKRATLPPFATITTTGGGNGD